MGDSEKLKEEKGGYDEADGAADEGVGDHCEGLLPYGKYLHARSKRYCQYVEEVQSMVLGVMKKSSELREEQAQREMKRVTPFHG